MSLAGKLQVRAGSTVAVVAPPDDVDLALGEGVTLVADAAEADVVIAFVRDAAVLGAVAGPALDAARADRLAWIAYPKAGQLGTDLNRDSLARLCQDRGARPVRQVSIDDVWSALRFRPGT